MCGIAGIASLDGRVLDGDVDRAILDAMGAAIGHRGPDDTRVVLRDGVGFVFKRLSIVDLAHGEQPLESPDGRVCLMANGEIYNHRALRADLARRHALASGSDCAVLGPMYVERGLDFLRDVNGMFAIALHDRAKRRLLLARDRTGVKPLFFCVFDRGCTLAFASELKALFAHPAVPREFDWQAALDSMLFADTESRELPSLFRGIERVPAAAMVEWDLVDGARRDRVYWTLPPDDDDAPASPAHAYVEAYRALLADSVRLRLPDEVGFGLFLSGGVDSAAIAALAAKERAFPAFTVLSASTAADAISAEAVARYLTLPFHALLFDASERITPAHWRQVLWACELPSATAEQLYKFHLHAHARALYPGLKVMLLGQGSDEFNGGYIGWTLGGTGPWDPSHWALLRDELARQQAHAAATRSGIAAPLHDLVDRGVLDAGFVRASAGRPSETEGWRLYVGRYRRNLDYHLWHEDRTAAAHAIENRVPYLDYRLLELLASIPRVHRAELFADKQILRRAVSDLLPAEIARRPKGYFFYGRKQHHTILAMARLLQSNGGELVEQALRGSARTGGPLEAAAFRVWIEEIERQSGHADLPRALSLVNMGVLADMAARGFPAGESPGALGRSSTIGAWDETREGRKALAHVRGTERPEDIVVAMPCGTSVVELNVGASADISAGVYLVTNGRLGARIDSPAWAKFLLLVDGRRSVAALVDAARLNGKRTWRLVQAALEDGSLVEVETERDGDPAAAVAGAMSS
jgi:asparagine synthase (glutamine-hydrolysing)